MCSVAESERAANGVDYVAIVRALVEEVPDVLTVSLVGDAAERADAAAQPLSQPGRDDARRRSAVDRTSAATRGLWRIAGS